MFCLDLVFANFGYFCLRIFFLHDIPMFQQWTHSQTGVPVSRTEGSLSQSQTNQSFQVSPSTNPQINPFAIKVKHQNLNPTILAEIRGKKHAQWPFTHLKRVKSTHFRRRPRRPQDPRWRRHMAWKKPTDMAATRHHRAATKLPNVPTIPVQKRPNSSPLCSRSFPL